MLKTIFYDLVYAFFFRNRTYSGKITITFEPLVQFWEFKALNWSKFNFLLICAYSSLLLSIARKMPEKIIIEYNKPIIWKKKFFFKLWREDLLCWPYPFFPFTFLFNEFVKYW